MLKGERVDPVPVWMMRQAGRHLPEYREVRAKARDFLDFCYSPSLAAEATLQPVRRYGMDGAILLMAITMKKNKSGKPTRSRRTCKGVGLVTCGHPESVSRGTSMLRSSFTALRYRPDAVPRRL